MSLIIDNGRGRLFRNPIATLMMGMVIAGSGIVGAGKAQAAIVQWTLTNVTFDDGGIATGSLVGGPPPNGAPIPEPGTILLIGSGLAGLGIPTRRRNKKVG